jgi:hypothetical protein
VTSYIRFEESLNSVIENEIERLVNQIAWIDGRLLDLDDTEEDTAERKLLLILRRHLMKDLYELAGFVWEEPGKEEKTDVPIVAVGSDDKVKIEA